MKEYYNLKIVDWNFDYARNKRLAIRGEIVRLPAEIGDKYPKLFKPVRATDKPKANKPVETKKVDVKEEVVTTEKEVEIQEDEQVVTDEKPVEEVQEKSELVLEFENGIEDGSVSAGTKFYSWNGRRGLISDWKKAETDEEKEAYIKDAFID